jgi:excisionase family DNA binding protein
VLTVREAAAQLGCGLSTIYDLCSTGQLGHLRIGRAIRIEQSDIDRFKQDARRMPAPPNLGLRHIRPRPAGCPDARPNGRRTG